MARRERPIDPQVGPLQRFAFDLRQLRQRAGPLSYRQLAARAHFSATALSEAAGGEKLPSLAVTLAYVRACGGNVGEWQERWRAVSVQLSPAAEATGDERDCPYPGLVTFGPEDAEWFFGRERLVGELLERVVNKPFLAVFGASGSGKSSLLHAGLLPALAAGRVSGSDGWSIVSFAPGAHPLEELAVRVATLQAISPGSLLSDLRADPSSFALAARQALAGAAFGARLLLVVDQFEEVFTLCESVDERAAFVTALLVAVQADGRVGVVLGVRADFYGRCADYPALVAALRDAQVLVGPMSGDELRRVIVAPAARVGLGVEPALVATAVADVLGRPGALPLLSHALRETWRRRRGTVLRLAAYQEAGGVEEAIAQSAEQVYAGLNASEQGIAKAIFLRLTALGEGTDDTSRRIRRSEVLAGADGVRTQPVLDRMVSARLITVGTDSVEVAHEALIREWPRLRQWLVDDRDALRVHRRLTEAAVDWDRFGRDPDAVFRGTRLQDAVDWAAEHQDTLNAVERDFLMAGQQRRTGERIAERRRVRVAVIGLSTALAVITALTLVTVAQRNQARNQRDIALSRQLATSAEAQLRIDPQLSLLLARQAYAIRRTPEAETVLRQATIESRVRATLVGHGAPIAQLTFSPDGRRIASAGDDGTVRVWDLADHRPPVVLGGHTGRVHEVAFSPDGRQVASGGDDTTVRIWDLTADTPPTILTGHAGEIRCVVFSPDGRWVVSGSADGTVRIWSANQGVPPVVLSGHTAAVNAVVFSPDGRRVVSGSADGTVRIWDPDNAGSSAILANHGAAVTSVMFSLDGGAVASGGEDGTVRVGDPTGRSEPTVLQGHSGIVEAVAFGMGGRLVSAGSDGTVRLWDPAARRQLLTLTGHDRPVERVIFAPDGRIASAGDDGTIRVWNPACHGEPLVLRGHHGPIYTIAFSPDGRSLASAGSDGAVRIWDPAPAGNPVLLCGHQASVGGGIAFTPDGLRLATASDDATVRVWHTAGTEQPVVLHGHKGPVYAAALRPDGQQLASAGDDGTVRLWDLAGRTPPVVLRGHERSVFDVTFSPDGRHLATASGDGTVRVWSPDRGDSELVLRGHDGPVYEVEYSPDGKRLVSAGDDGTARIWDLTGQNAPMVLRGHIGPVGGIAFSPDGKHVATAGYDATVRIWDAAKGTVRLVLHGHDGAVNSVAFSPDGQLIATASGDATVSVWDATTGAVRQVLRGHEGAVTGVTFSPDGRSLASAGSDGVVRIWQCETCGPIDDVLALARERTTRPFNAEEKRNFLHGS